MVRGVFFFDFLNTKDIVVGNDIDEDYDYYEHLIIYNTLYLDIFRCKFCFKKFAINISDENTIDTSKYIHCWRCSTIIVKKSMEHKKTVEYKKKIYTELYPILLNEILQIGMHPNRIKQTQLVETEFILSLLL